MIGEKNFPAKNGAGTVPPPQDGEYTVDDLKTALEESERSLHDAVFIARQVWEKDCDAVAVVTAPPEVQRARVLARDTMTPAMFETILARQLPDADKRARADYVIETQTLEAARAAVKDVLAGIRRRIARNA